MDIRRFPGSRKHPHFSRDNLAVALPQAGMEYHGSKRSEVGGTGSRTSPLTWAW